MDKLSLYDFIDDYNEFWQKVLEEEKEKLKNISSCDLALVQKSIKDQQAVIMQIENLEEKRIALQKECGLENKSLREILEDAEEGFKPRLKNALDLFQKTMEEIKFYNNKSNTIAKEHLDAIGVSPDEEKLGGYAPDRETKGVLLGKKI